MSEFHVHLFSYRKDGSNWSVAVPATSEEDARDRLMRASLGKFDGNHATEIPAWLPAAPLYARVATWLRNALRRGLGQ